MPASVPAVAFLHRQRARLDRRRLSVDRVIAAMRERGVALHVSHEKSGDLWWLSDGSRVTAETAKLAVVHPNIINVGDGLFGGELSQTFRCVEA